MVETEGSSRKILERGEETRMKKLRILIAVVAVAVIVVPITLSVVLPLTAGGQGCVGLCHN